MGLPAFRCAFVDYTFMQTKLAVVPELEMGGYDAIAGPERRPRYLADAKFRRMQGDLLFEIVLAFHRMLLIARPGADLAAAIAGRKIGVRRGFIDLGGCAFNSYLTFQRFPVEQQRHAWIRRNFVGFSAFEVGVEDKAAPTVVLQ